MHLTQSNLITHPPTFFFFFFFSFPPYFCYPLFSLSLSLFTPFPVYSARKVPSLSDLRAELNDLTTELQSLEANGDDEDITDEDSSSTEVSSLSSLDLSEKEYRNRSVKLIDQVKSKNDRLVQSLGVILNSHPSKSIQEIGSNDTSSLNVNLQPDVINAASNLMSAVESVQNITRSLKNLPLED